MPCTGCDVVKCVRCLVLSPSRLWLIAMSVERIVLLVDLCGKVIPCRFKSFSEPYSRQLSTLPYSPYASDFDCLRHPTLELLSILTFYLLPPECYLICIFRLSGDLYVSTLWSGTVCIPISIYQQQCHCNRGIVIIVVIVISHRL